MQKVEQLPIYQKALNINKLVESFMLALPQEDVFLHHSKSLMMEDAIIIPAKIAAAEGGDLYSIRMQNAAIIRTHALHLYAQIGSLRFHSKFKDLEYVTLLRQELDEFRLLFVEWIESFDTTNHIWDEWGMFNPSDALPPNTYDDDYFGMDDFSEDDY
ncbi:hypothetical protein FLAN108750_07695 [Flavobacterium antarcticum]|uniref:hypothetical protein n=1 Tax=Flavobacterium antarcticum TaxID=271155 RepID=UPI0003B76FDD|nr:hypothetical protein [Flavobacterium antarcticum]